VFTLVFEIRLGQFRQVRVGWQTTVGSGPPRPSIWARKNVGTLGRS
jgi:hypothetical protein